MAAFDVFTLGPAQAPYAWTFAGAAEGPGVGSLCRAQREDVERCHELLLHAAGGPAALSRIRPDWPGWQVPRRASTSTHPA